MNLRNFFARRWSRRIWLAVLILLAVIGLSKHRATPTMHPAGLFALHADDRILILAPHPDDEVIACGGIIEQANAMKLPVRVVFLTYGDNNEWSFALYRRHPVLAPSAVLKMGMVRHDEAVRADTKLGLTTNDLTFLGYPDFGTLDIWNRHWGAEPSAQSILTRARCVPYSSAYQYGTPYKGEAIVHDLTAIIREFRPTQIFVPHPADFNTDHRALYLFAQIALWDLEREIKPALHMYLVHFPDWPSPKRFVPTSPSLPPRQLARAIDWMAFRMTPSQVSLKNFALREHKTQFKYSSRYLSSFVRSTEIFGHQQPVVYTSLSGTTTDTQAIASEETAGPTDDLTEQERALFTGLEWRLIRMDDAGVTVSIVLSRPLGRAVSASLQVFGYRQDVPFEDMPKISVDVSPTGYKVRDQSHVLPDDQVTLTHAPCEITLTLPFSLLRKPERLLISARTYLGNIPLDWATWQSVEIQPAPKGPN